MALQVDTSDYKRIAKALKDAGKDVRREGTKAARNSAKPVAEYVRIEGASRMPAHGGYAYKVAGASIVVAASTMRASVSLGTRQHMALKRVDAGNIRKPVFGNRKVWRDQAVEPRAFTDAFEKTAPLVLKEMTAAMQRVLDQLGDQ